MDTDQHVLEDAVGIDVHIGYLAEVRRRHVSHGPPAPAAPTLSDSGRSRRGGGRALGARGQSRAAMLPGPRASANRVPDPQHRLANGNLAPCHSEATRVPLKGNWEQRVGGD